MYLQGEVFAALFPLLLVLWACMLLWLLIMSAHHFLLLACCRRDWCALRRTVLHGAAATLSCDAPAGSGTCVGSLPHQ
jgi:hypothetical protein